MRYAASVCSGRYALAPRCAMTIGVDGRWRTDDCAGIGGPVGSAAAGRRGDEHGCGQR
jgi:hypothetical protein